MSKVKERCDRCRREVGWRVERATWLCRGGCDRSICEECLGDYDYDSDTGSYARCPECLAGVTCTDCGDPFAGACAVCEVQLCHVHIKHCAACSSMICSVHAHHEVERDGYLVDVWRCGVSCCHGACGDPQCLADAMA